MFNNLLPDFLLFRVIEFMKPVVYMLSTPFEAEYQCYPNFIYTMLIMCKVNNFLGKNV